MLFQLFWVGSKGCLGFFHNILQKNKNEILGQPDNTKVLSMVTN